MSAELKLQLNKSECDFLLAHISYPQEKELQPTYYDLITKLRQVVRDE